MLKKIFIFFLCLVSAVAVDAGPKKGASKKSKTPAKAVTAQQVQKQQEAVQREVADTRKAIKANDANIQKGLSDLQSIQADINSSQQRVSALGKELKNINDKIASLQSQISSQQKELDNMRAQYLKAVKKMRVAKKQNSDLAFIFSSKNFNQAMRRLRYLREFSQWRDKQTKMISARVAQLQRNADLLAQNQRAKAVTMRSQEQVNQQLRNDYTRKDAIVADLRRNGEALNAHLRQKQQEANALRNQVSALIAQEETARQQAAARQRQQEAEQRAARQRADEQRRQEAAQREAARQQLAQQQAAQQQQESAQKKDKKKDQKKKTSSAQQPTQQSAQQPTPKKQSGQDYASARKRAPRGDNKQTAQNQPAPKKQQPVTVANNIEQPKVAVTPSSSSFDAMRGRLPRPVSGAFRVKSPFGRHAMPGLPGVSYDNPGIDIETSSGAQARAVFAGKVSGVYKVPGFGTVVIVSHGNYYTVYGNLNGVAVAKGDAVKQGQAVGSVANDSDNASHGELHFEIWKNRDKLNPMDWIQ